MKRVKLVDAPRLDLRSDWVLNDAAFLTLPGLNIPLGMTEQGELGVIDLKEVPHLLVAGSGKTGKSTLLHTLLRALALRIRPVLIDPHRELARYHALPHLFLPTATDGKAALTTLQQVRMEMKHRQELTGTERGEEFPVVVIIDDLPLADPELSDSEREQLLRDLTTILTEGAAVGVHVVMAVQRPIPELLPLFTHRLIFQLPAEDAASMNCANLGPETLSFGHAYYMAQEQESPVRLQMLKSQD